MVSSVTYMTGSPSPTANAIASSVSFSSWSIPQPSAYCRSGLDPMNVQHSISTPVRCAISTTGLMSAITVLAAQLARTVEPLIANLAREALDVPHDVGAGAGQADIGGIDPEPIDQVEDPQLLVDARAPHGRRLQAVPERLVVQQDRAGARCVSLVPVVYEPVHLLQRGSSRGRRAR